MKKISGLKFITLLFNTGFVFEATPMKCVLFIYVGILPLSDLDECVVANPCQNNGTCNNNNGSYVCTCNDGWQGKDCEKGILDKQSLDVLFAIKSLHLLNNLTPIYLLLNILKISMNVNFRLVRTMGLVLILKDHTFVTVPQDGKTKTV